MGGHFFGLSDYSGIAFYAGLRYANILCGCAVDGPSGGYTHSVLTRLIR